MKEASGGLDVLDNGKQPVREGRGPSVKIALALIRGYKLLISPHNSGSCRFVPSCADYARDAVLLHGVLKGSWLALRRVARCHPFCVGGHDPVPSR